MTTKETTRKLNRKKVVLAETDHSGMLIEQLDKESALYPDVILILHSQTCVHYKN